MSEFACINGRVLLPDGSIAEDHGVIVRNGTISTIGASADCAAGLPTVDLRGNLLAPGFIDVQVNGGGGALFNDRPSVESLRTIGAAHAMFGTTAFLPTLISDDLDVIEQAYAAVNQAIAEQVPGVIGIHVEGPFLNVERKGIHPAGKIRELDDAGFRAVLANKPELTLMTLAPECVHPETIKALTHAGILIFAGHSDASYTEMQAAFDAGLVGATHLFNAMSQLRGREPGVVGAALNNPDCWCCIIVDGVHVHPITLRLALQARGSLDRFILVTDAMPTVGQDKKRFNLNGQTITVEGGVCQNADGTLAGSDLSMAAAVGNCSALLGLTGPQSITLASGNPARLLGLDGRTGSLAPGLDADMIEISSEGVVERTWIRGRLVWDRHSGQARGH